MNKFKKIYIAGALTCVGDRQNELYAAYGKIEEIARQFAEDVFNPNRRGFCPSKDPGVTPRQVWEAEEKHVSESDLTIAYVGEPSLGTGGELEIARISGKKIILWWFKGEKVSRFSRGNPAVIEMIEAENKENLLFQLQTILTKQAW
jgi:hypothetical protein